jgi:hypothetical protein
MAPVQAADIFLAAFKNCVTNIIKASIRGTIWLCCS